MDQSENASNCPNGEDFSPCECSGYFRENQKYFNLECTKVPINQVYETLKSKTAANINEFILREYVFDVNVDFVIPNNFFVDHLMSKIIVRGVDSDRQKTRLEIHPEAFRSSRNSSKEAHILSIDMSSLNFSFLTGFEQLTNLFIWNAVNAHVSGLPLLQKLNELRISHSSGLNEWTHFPPSINALSGLILQHNGLVDEAVYRVLEWIVTGPSKDTLQWLYLSGNSLTRIPPQIKLFSKLCDIYLDGQQSPGFGVVPASSLNFPGPVRFLNLASCHITEIHNDNFKGKIDFNLKKIIFRSN